MPLLDRAARFQVPDPGIVNGFRACLADLFIMREPVAGGAIAGVPGTEAYRAANSFEAGIMAIALDQMGLHDKAEMGYRACLEMQEPDGNWDDPQGWGHLMWGGAGFKAWAAMEHYRLTGDRQFLERVYPRLAASSRWQERQRSRTRTEQGTKRSLAYGLMPRGMGDCGLMDDGDLYGVFLPHNIWAVYADKLALEAAEILGQTGDGDELRRIYETGRADLLTALDRGAIREADYRWIPGVAGKTSGSRWGALNALFPCRLLPPDHELISGTIRKIESNMSPGGIPIHTGWLADGMWVAITLDNLAEAHLTRHNGDAAARYLYATLNHATPLVTWCEERGPEPGTKKCTGDRQHLWTPVAVVRCLRDCLVMEEGDNLELAARLRAALAGRGRPHPGGSGGHSVRPNLLPDAARSGNIYRFRSLDRCGRSSIPALRRSQPARSIAGRPAAAISQCRIGRERVERSTITALESAPGNTHIPSPGRKLRTWTLAILTGSSALSRSPMFPKSDARRLARILRPIQGIMA